MVATLSYASLNIHAWRHNSYPKRGYRCIILTQNEAIDARPPPLAVAVPMTSFWVIIVTHSCINIKRGVLSYQSFNNQTLIEI